MNIQGLVQILALILAPTAVLILTSALKPIVKQTLTKVLVLQAIHQLILLLTLVLPDRGTCTNTHTSTGNGTCMSL